MYILYQISTRTTIIVSFLLFLFLIPMTGLADYQPERQYRYQNNTADWCLSPSDIFRVESPAQYFSMKEIIYFSKTKIPFTCSYNIFTVLGYKNFCFLYHNTFIKTSYYININKFSTPFFKVQNKKIEGLRNSTHVQVSTQNEHTNKNPHLTFFKNPFLQSTLVTYTYIVISLLLFIALFFYIHILRKRIKQSNKLSDYDLNKKKFLRLGNEAEKEKYRILFDAVADPILVVDIDTAIIVECNKNAGALFGKSRNELIGLHQSQLDPQNIKNNGDFDLTNKFKTLLKNPNTTMEIPLRCAQGRIQMLSVQVALLTHNEQNLIMGVFHDITKQKQLLDTLNKKERLLRKAQSIVKLGHWELDTINNKLFWSEEVYHIFGIDPREQKMSYETFMDCVHPEDWDAVNNAYTQSLREKRDGYEINHRIIRKDDNQLRYVQEKCEHVKNQEGEIILSIGTVQDTTEQSTTELRLRDALYNAELANKSKSIFLANMSHEIRTPLNGIIGMLQLLQFEQPSPLQLEYLTHAMNSGQRLARLLSDILDLSKVDTGALTLHSDPFDLNELVHSLRQLFTPAIKQKNLDLYTFIEPSIQTNLIGDTLRLQQVLTNIIGNAIKFTESGSIELEIFPLPGAEKNQCKLLFSVTDDGIGIPGDKLDTLFDAFTQVETSYMRQFQGAGLGLSISKKLISLMGGELSISSSPGVGSCFQFCIPFPINQAPPCPSPQQNNAYSLEARNILLAEDDEVSQRAIAGLLERMGQKVRVVGNGLEVLAALQHEDFDIVLMDIQMPIMEGVEATKAIRAGKAGKDKKNIPIVAVTAYAMVGDQDIFLEAGMNAYLSKPVHYERLQSVLTNFAETPASKIQTH